MALLGTYLFLRRQPVSSTAATFGAVTFAFAGYMTAQIVHIDLIEGAAWLPWMLLAIHALTDPTGHRRTTAGERADADGLRQWVAVLGIALGLSVLTGSAEAIIDSARAPGRLLVGRLITSGYLRRDNPGHWRLRWLTLVAGVGPGAGPRGGPVDARPGVPSQVAAPSGELRLLHQRAPPGPRSSRSAGVAVHPGDQPDRPRRATPGLYNFHEVTSYMGILALIAACSLFLRRFRTRPEARQWWVWYVIAGVGLLSALGGQTPFGHVLFLIPGLNSERLLNRNLLLVDFSLAVLVAWWVHVLLDTAGERPP